ncbi:hypothetical protein MJI69_28340, partial [Salmonella enterica subsp. enterica serovar Anatum]|nr:hypothetical protein [Salmonella enterica subsp. enterica serovar Anatum]
WGKYDSIDAGERYQVKRITVKPGEGLSVQMHHHRAEHWVVVADIALRSLPSAALLFAGTAIIGCGIALGNVLLPGLIKRDFSQHV